MISFSCRTATTEDRDQIKAWPSAFSFSSHAFCASSASCQVLLDERGALCGLFCYGDGVESLWPDVHLNKRPLSLCFSVLFSPDFASICRYRAVEFALQWLRKRFQPPHFVAYIYASDVDSVNIYQRLGFFIRSQSAEGCALELDDRPFLDASMPLQNGIPQYEGDPPFRRTLCAETENGGYNVSLLTMSLHTGTHIDTPAHVGLCGMKTIDPSLLHGAVQLVDWPRPNFNAVLSSRVLLMRAQRGLTKKEAETLIQAGVSLVGIDRLSVGIEEDEWIVHRNLLENGVIILENANLHGFRAGWYQMRCLPLSIPGSDGLPVRLLLREELP
jgi:arylformamidase